ncbi:MAG: glycosyltransferase family 4 protein [Caldilineaceae bacterium]|nr:glycosyltransferase family 4 protein [Caldilineaceae bacterium]
MASSHPHTIRLFNTVEPVTTFYRDLIPYWEERGWQVEVVISRAEYRAGRDKTWISDKTIVRRTPALGLKAKGRPAKMAIMLSYLTFGMIYSLFGRNVDRNVFLTQPPLFFVWGVVLKKLRRQPYFIVLMDLYPDVAIEDGLLAPGGLVARLLLALSRFGLRHADGVIVIGRCMQELVAAIGVRQSRIHFIPNWTDESKVVSIQHEQNSFRQEMGWQDKFVVMYSGNVGTSHYFDDILTVCSRLRVRSDIVFAFIGHGQRRKEIEQAVEELSSDNIMLLPFQPLERLAESLSAGNLHFVSLRDNFTGLVVPSKMYGILAAGRPVIYQGSATGEMARLLTEENIGSVISIGDVKALETTILDYADHPERAKEQGEHARILMESKFGKEAACRRYSSILAPHLECEG